MHHTKPALVVVVCAPLTAKTKKNTYTYTYLIYGTYRRISNTLQLGIFILYLLFCAEIKPYFLWGAQQKIK